MNKLPMGWVEVELGSCVEILDNQRIPINNDERQSRIENKELKDLFPYYGATGQVGWIDDYIFDGDLIALGEDGVPFFDPKKPKAYKLSGKTWVNNHAHVLKGIDGITNNAFILHFLNSFDYHGFVNGGTRLKLTQANMKKIPIPLPPKAEQDHIATLLDNYLSQVATISQKLNDILPIIKQFRQSVLAQAVSGKLLADLDFDSWQTVKLSEISQIKGGKRLPKGHELLSEKTPYPYIRVTDFDNASVNLDNLKYLNEETRSLIKNYTISKNDLYISIAGTIGLVGEIPEVLDGANLTENSAKICDIKPEVSKDFLKLCLNSYQIKEQFDDKVTSSGQPKLALFRIRDCVIPLPPLTEQQQIVAEVERLFAVADSIETQVKEALERVGHLTQSILHQAFTGNLSADWRACNADLITGEHSATALLAQIKQAEPKSPRKKKTQ